MSLRLPVKLLRSLQPSSSTPDLQPRRARPTASTASATARRGPSRCSGWRRRCSHPQLGDMSPSPAGSAAASKAAPTRRPRAAAMSSAAAPDGAWLARLAGAPIAWYARTRRRRPDCARSRPRRRTAGPRTRPRDRATLVDPFATATPRGALAPPPLFTAGRRPCSRRRSQFRTPPVPIGVYTACYQGLPCAT